MKKRAMKKWIPKDTIYCHGRGTKKSPYCKWLKYITTIYHDENTCEFSKECQSMTEGKGCSHCPTRVYKCEYMNYIDWDEDSLLWDECKECGVKEDFY